jgi:predicted enzyme related to lactoylglutathione lyase
MKLELSRVILFTRDVAALGAFYEQVLGLALVPGADDQWREYAAGGCRIALHKGKSPSGDRGVKLVFGVADVAAARQHLIARGAKLGPIKAFGKLQLCDGKDPDGNVYQLSNRSST